MKSPIEIRRLTASEVPILLDWAKVEGWNPSPDDAEAFYAADPEGFIGGFVEGRLVSGISAILYGPHYGFIGLYICHPDFRGRGLGMAVWKAGMERLSGRTVGLDGVPAQQGNYEKMGFRKAHVTARWSGQIPSGWETRGALPANAAHVEQILSVDRICFPADRAAFVRKWITLPRHAYVMERDGKVTGYAVVRRCVEGFKIGPIFARDLDAAIALAGACRSEIGDAVVHLDVPATQEAFTARLRAQGFQRGFETARMYMGPPPKISLTGVYAVTTLELG